MSSSSDESATPLTRTRKRVRREFVVNSAGLETSGKNFEMLVPPRVLGYDCKCPMHCMHCFKNVSQSDRSVILDEFKPLTYRMLTCMVSFIDLVINDAIYLKQQGGSSKRKSTFSYFVRLHGKKVKVCLKAFCGIHGISVKRVRNVRVKDCMPPLDQRGRHNQRPNRIPEVTNNFVKKHVLSFP